MQKNNIIKLMFSPYGEISRREYRCGIIILLLIISASVSLTGISNIVSITGNWFGSSYIYSLSILQQLLYQYTPIFVPYRFILFISTIFISIKRVRSLKGNLALGVLTGILLYTLFTSIIIIPSVGGYLGHYLEENIFLVNIKIVVIILAILSVLGLFQLIFLILYNGSNSEKEDILIDFNSKQPLSQLSYIDHMGKIYIYSICFFLFLFALGFILNLLETDIRTILIVSLVLGIIFQIYVIIRFLQINIRREKDLGLSGNLFLRIYLLSYLGAFTWGIITYLVYHHIILIISEEKAFIILTVLSFFIITLLNGCQFYLIFFRKSKKIF